MAEKHYRNCNLCEAICGIEITHENGEILRIEGDKADPFSRAHICPKAVALKDIYEDTDRLRNPVRRTANGWEAITWEDAFDQVAEKLVEIQTVARLGDGETANSLNRKRLQAAREHLRVSIHQLIA